MKCFASVLIAVLATACNSVPEGKSDDPLANSVAPIERAPTRGDTEVTRQAVFVDQDCLGHCLEDCGKACEGRGAGPKAGCIRQCRQDNADCRASCTKPGDPPNCNGGCVPGASCIGGRVCRCPEGETICASGCANLDSDDDHCGGCTQFCPDNTHCRTIAGFTRCFFF
jgi:hypothetical protein